MWQIYREKLTCGTQGGLVSGWKQIIENMDVLGIDAEKFTEYPAVMISEAFEFEEMEYFSRIKMFNRMLDKLGLI